MERYKPGVDRFIVGERINKHGMPREWVILRLMGKLNGGEIFCEAIGYPTRRKAEKAAQTFRDLREPQKKS